MKTLVALISTLVLAGCMYQSVNKYDMDAAIEVCGDYSKVVEIRADAFGSEVVVCANSTSARLHTR